LKLKGLVYPAFIVHYSPQKYGQSTGYCVTREGDKLKIIFQYSVSMGYYSGYYNFYKPSISRKEIPIKTVGSIQWVNSTDIRGQHTLVRSIFHKDNEEWTRKL